MGGTYLIPKYQTHINILFINIMGIYLVKFEYEVGTYMYEVDRYLH